ncbi:hypothetical protein [Novosphingobium olei]|uniref:Uncharacterized protein n=1 Tax=Novosphingobium olei TaxID=2728851 RepID=A0A7Y0G7Z9_9SPHN|nr:hypothetical protein [Novosphingobium olei]NML92496.1 hypothetical protein [Novosphingobium olei]BEV01648.1 hypothetical protein NSDW_27420 [Novosphingobium olei]
MAFPGIPKRKTQSAAARAEAPIAPIHHVPLSPRALRAQAVHRLQVGLFGLAGMLLLVSLANVIMDRAQVGDSAAAMPDAAASSSAANDPLVDMGVAPELPVNGGGAAAPAQQPAARPKP